MRTLNLAQRHGRHALRIAKRSGSLVGQIRALRANALGAFCFGVIPTAERMVADAQQLEELWRSEHGCRGSVVADSYVTDALILAERWERSEFEELLYEHSLIHPRLVTGPLVLTAEVEMVRRSRGAYQAVLTLRRLLAGDGRILTGESYFARRLRLFCVDLLAVLGDLATAEAFLRESAIRAPGHRHLECPVEVVPGRPGGGVA